MSKLTASLGSVLTLSCLTLTMHTEILTIICQTTIYPLPSHKGIAKNSHNQILDSRLWVLGDSQALPLVKSESSDVLLLKCSFSAFSFASLRCQNQSLSYYDKSAFIREVPTFRHYLGIIIKTKLVRLGMAIFLPCY